MNTPSSERENKECLCYKSHTTTPISCGCYCHDKKVATKDSHYRALIEGAIKDLEEVAPFLRGYPNVKHKFDITLASLRKELWK